MEDYVNDLKNFLDALNITKCVLVGHSFGSAVAMVFAGLFPTRVRKLVLIGSISIKGFPLYKLDNEGLQTNKIVSSYKELLNERLPIDLEDNKMLQIYFEEVWFNQGKTPLDLKKYVQESQLQKCFIAVSYTHLTLPTKRIVQISGVAGAVKKKQVVTTYKHTESVQTV
eukprot:TRINITY_DN13690_c0_g1_i4.p2 TRINITY_DN13690_c0_g1~~TRINITY_DN13690_c0_g1_i4.p2  ORF type:complete len:169 (-),score=30.47 TRINITY_DN13690_c0_g1_i4:7-513(-)